MYNYNAEVEVRSVIQLIEKGNVEGISQELGKFHFKVYGDSLNKEHSLELISQKKVPQPTYTLYSLDIIHEGKVIPVFTSQELLEQLYNTLQVKFKEIGTPQKIFKDFFSSLVWSTGNTN